MNQYDQSIHVLEKALEINPEEHFVKSALANAYISQGDTVRAFQLNYEIIKSDPSVTKPYINLGKYSILTGDTLKAMEYFHKAYDIDSNNYDANFNLNYFYSKLNNYNKAMFYKKRLMEIQKNFEKRRQHN